MKENLLFAERFIRTLNRYMNSVSKNIHIDKLDDIVNTYNNTYQKNYNETCWCKTKHIYWLK